MTAGVNFDSLPSKPKPQTTQAPGIDFDKVAPKPAASRGVDFDSIGKPSRGVDFDKAGSSADGLGDYKPFDPTPPTSSIAKYLPWIADASKRYGVPAWAVKAIIGQESGVNVDYRRRESRHNLSGATGIGQFMPDTARGLGIDPLDPRQSIYGIAHYLADKKKAYPQLDWAGAAAAGAAAARDGSPALMDAHIKSGVPLPLEMRRYVANMRIAQTAGEQAAAAQQHVAAHKAIAKGNAASGGGFGSGVNFDSVQGGTAYVPPTKQPPLPPAIALVASGISNALDFQRWMAHGLVTSAAHGGIGKGTWDPDTQRAEQRNLIPGLDQQYHEGGYHFGAPIPVMVGSNVVNMDLDKLQDVGNQAGRGIIDAALDTALDPLTWETLGFGAVFKSLGPRLTVETLKAVNSTPFSRWAYDQLHWAGEITRTRGQAAADTLRGAVHQGRSEGALFGQRMDSYFKKVVAPLDDQNRLHVGQALHGELDPAKLSEPEQKAFRQLRTLTMIDWNARRQTAQAVVFRNYSKDLPAAERRELQQALKSGKRPDISTPDLQMRYDQIQHLIDERVPFKENYMPSVHPGNEGHAAYTSSPTEYNDPRFLHQEDFHVTEPAQLQDGFKAMALNANRQRSYAVINESLGDLLDDPVVERTLQRIIPATGNARTDWEKVKDGWRAVVGYPRAGVVSLTPRHAVNIMDLLVNTVPLQEQKAVMTQTMRLAGQIFDAVRTGNLKEYAKLTKEGRDMGAISGGFTERQAFFQHALPETVNLPLLGTKKVPFGGKQIRGLSDLAQFNNDLVWAVDDAAKQVYGKMLKRTGEAQGLEAGGMSQRRLVDYENLSNVQKAARYVAPFGTFRGGIPGAVIGGVAREPMRAAVVNRLTGGRFYGDKPESGDPGISYGGPTAEVGRALTWGTDARTGDPETIPWSGPAQFLESSLADPAQDLVGAFKSRSPLTQNDYGKSWLPGTNGDGTWNIGVLASQALAGVPEAQTVLNAMGIGQFQWRGLAAEAARQTPGVQVHP